MHTLQAFTATYNKKVGLDELGWEGGLDCTSGAFALPLGYDLTQQALIKLQQDQVFAYNWGVLQAPRHPLRKYLIHASQRSKR